MKKNMENYPIYSGFDIYESKKVFANFQNQQNSIQYKQLIQKYKTC